MAANLSRRSSFSLIFRAVTQANCRISNYTYLTRSLFGWLIILWRETCFVMATAIETSRLYKAQLNVRIGFIILRIHSELLFAFWFSIIYSLIVNSLVSYLISRNVSCLFFKLLSFRNLIKINLKHFQNYQVISYNNQSWLETKIPINFIRVKNCK